MDNQYFEGILQLRNPPEEAFRVIKNQLKIRENVHIAKEVKQKNGVDLYVSSNSFTMRLGKMLKKTFQAELKLSRKLHTVNHLTSKNSYRVTVLVRFKE